MDYMSVVLFTHHCHHHTVHEFLGLNSYDLHNYCYVHFSELQSVLQVSSLGYQFEFATIRLPRILCPLSPHLLGNIPLDCDIVLQSSEVGGKLHVGNLTENGT